MASPSFPRLAVTLGDPRGIGPEVVERALVAGRLEARVTLIGADEQIASIPAHRRIGVGPWGSGERGAGPPVASQGAAPRSPLPERAGQLAGRAVEQAVRLALAGEVDAVVTGPVHKLALHLAGFRFPGLTEMLAHLAGDVDVAMMLTAGGLRVVLVTTHLPLRDVPQAVTTERVVRTGRITETALQRWWGIGRPRLAVCALNPHAGESGLFGDEDDLVLGPAARALGAAGPVPADTVFVRALKGEFDAVLAPYHDVGMTAVKVAGFGKGVNVTLGLPFPRTAPDHGTALDIAGKGVADPGSMLAALELAVELARRAVARR
ncbi:MAG TPA: 4-hydroxythreonine-4-phosphate dehydrogenase PdxA [Gemmatimonadales bacterium]|nr:4-hydroxythreonine-4-phosphate dehydrogenase PdxA [Gemmatimonadales bacterium]